MTMALGLPDSVALGARYMMARRTSSLDPCQAVERMFGDELNVRMKTGPRVNPPCRSHVSSVTEDGNRHHHRNRRQSLSTKDGLGGGL